MDNEMKTLKERIKECFIVLNKIYATFSVQEKKEITVPSKAVYAIKNGVLQENASFYSRSTGCKIQNKTYQSVTGIAAVATKSSSTAAGINFPDEYNNAPNYKLVIEMVYNNTGGTTNGKMAPRFSVWFAGGTHIFIDSGLPSTIGSGRVLKEYVLPNKKISMICTYTNQEDYGSPVSSPNDGIIFYNVYLVFPEYSETVMITS